MTSIQMDGLMLDTVAHQNFPRRWFVFFSFLLCISAFSSTPSAALDVSIASPSRTSSATSAWIGAFKGASALEREKVSLNFVPPQGRARDFQAVLSSEINLGLFSLDEIPQLLGSNANAIVFGPILTQPFLYRDDQETMRMLSSPLGDAALSNMGVGGLLPIGFWSSGHSVFVSRNRITSADDFKGLKVRTFSRRAGDRVLEVLGAVPTPIVLAETYQAIEAGSVDAAEVPAEFASGIIQSASGGSVGNYRPSIGVLATNAKWWQSLTEAQRFAVAEAAGQASAASHEEVLAIEQSVRNVAEKYGVNPLAFSDQDQQQIEAASINAWGAYGGDRMSFIVGEMRAIRDQSRNWRGTSNIVRPVSNSRVRPTVIFVTDRIDEGVDVLKYRFGGRQASPVLACGKLDYSGGAGRKIGDAFEGPVEVEDRKVHQGQATCIDFIAKAMKSVKKQRMLFFVHGFNNTFDAAIRRAIASAIDTEFDGIVVAWSWPSDGSATSYLRDGETVRGTAPVIRTFVENLLQRPEVKSMDFLFHSMGNRLGTEIVDNLDREPANRSRIRYIVFAAPDEAIDLFEGHLDRTPKLNGRRTLYAAECDRPLRISEIINKSKRAGSGGKEYILIFDGLESVDVTDVETSCWWDRLTPLIRLLPLSHSYIFDNKVVVGDLAHILGDGRASPQRALLEAERSGENYYQLIEE